MDSRRTAVCAGRRDHVDQSRIFYGAAQRFGRRKDDRWIADQHVAGHCLDAQDHPDPRLSTRSNERQVCEEIMNTMQIVLLGATFIIVFGAALGVMLITRPNVLQRRLDAIAPGVVGRGVSATNAGSAGSAMGDGRPQWMETIAK